MPSLPNRHCPDCRELLDEVEALSEEGTTPSPGDLTICAFCATVLKFTEGLQLQVAREADIASLPIEAKVGLVQARIFFLRRIAEERMERARNN